MNIERRAYDDPAVEGLIQQLLVDLDERYGAQEDDDASGWIAEVTPAKVVPPDGVFLVAHVDGEPIGCGGVKRFDAITAEVKRMYTAPRGRRQGVARSILEQLEDEARALGYTKIRLETGTAQPEAMRLYESMDYAAIPSYGRYSADPRSRCFEKPL